MSNLHPRDEIAVRKNTCQVTLSAKQIEAAQVAAQIAEWLAKGNQINQAVGHCNKAAPFNPRNPDAAAAKDQAWKKFKVVPEGFKSRGLRISHARVQKDCAKKMREIWQSLLDAGEPMTSSQLIEKTGIPKSSLRQYIARLVRLGCVRDCDINTKQKLYEAIAGSQLPDVIIVIPERTMKWKQFEIQPEGKPKKEKPAFHHSTVKAMEVQQSILAHMQEHGAIASASLQAALGVSRWITDTHIAKMVKNGLIEHVATVAGTKFYNIKGRGVQGKKLQTTSHNAARGERTRGEIMQLLKAKGCGLSVATIAAAIDQSSVSAKHHIDILMDNGLVQITSTGGRAVLYGVAK